MAAPKSRFARLLNKRLLQVQERFVRTGRVFGSPFHLVLETGNRCNLRCPLCATPFREERIPTGRLKLEDARRIFDQFPYLYHVNLSVWGEPFLNRDIFGIIRYAKERDVEVLVQSNLNVMNADLAEQLVATNLDILQISLDGASQETYEKYRVGGDFGRVMENILLIQEAQRRANNFRTKIVWKMVVSRHNEHEVQAAREWSRRISVDFKVVEIYTPPQCAQEWKPRHALEKSSEVHTDVVPRCYSLWQVATVNFNGDVLPCCSEFSPKDALGNLFRQPFREIWNGPAYRHLRQANRGTLNCEACHKDKETRWYELWMGQCAG